MPTLIDVFGKGYDLLKVTKAMTEEDEEVEIDGETGETLTIWDWIEEGVAV